MRSGAGVFCAVVSAIALSACSGGGGVEGACNAFFEQAIGVQRQVSLAFPDDAALRQSIEEAPAKARTECACAGRETQDMSSEGREKLATAYRDGAERIAATMRDEGLEAGNERASGFRIIITGTRTILGFDEGMSESDIETMRAANATCRQDQD